jgi:hypothetical protein
MNSNTTVLCLNRSDTGSKKQHRIFDLIELGNSEDEEIVDNEVEVFESNGAPLLSDTVKFSTEENGEGKALSEQMEDSKENKNDVNYSHKNDFVPPKKDLISLVEDVGGKCLFSVGQTYAFVCVCVCSVCLVHFFLFHKLCLSFFLFLLHSFFLPYFIPLFLPSFLSFGRPCFL